MGNIDRRNKLDEEFFSYKVFKDNKVFIYWYGKHVMTLKGQRSEKFLADIEGTDSKDEQLIMARITGNFKRGNEKNNKKR